MRSMLRKKSYVTTKVETKCKSRKETGNRKQKEQEEKKTEKIKASTEQVHEHSETLNIKLHFKKSKFMVK